MKRIGIVTVPIHEEPARTMRLRTELAHGSGPNGEFEISLNVDGAALIARYAGRQFVILIKELVAAVLDVA